jgi:Flp pilus assembly protein TadG
MAIVVMLLFVVTFGILEYGWLFTKHSYVTNAARQGARVAARNGATAAQAITSAQAALTQGNIPLAAATITVTPNPIPANLATGSQITVTVSVNYDTGSGAIGLNLPFLPTPATIRATTVMAREGP